MFAAKRSSPSFKILPNVLPDHQPYYYLSTQQRRICRANPTLQRYVEKLPCWVPHRVVATALGYGEEGIDNALKRCPHGPYVWATEFENVHATWVFDEPDLQIGGVTYRGSEHFYQSQKPRPFDPKRWDSQRDSVMRVAVYHKFTSRSELKALLLSTHHHPLVSIKGDSYWGIFPDGRGENKLAKLLEELRTQLREELS